MNNNKERKETMEQQEEEKDMNIMNNDIHERYKGEINPFQVKEDKPMKLIIEKEDKTIEEHNLWYVNTDPAEMSSMSIVKAMYNARKMESKISHVYRDCSANYPVNEGNHLDAFNALNVFMNKVHKLFKEFKDEDDQLPRYVKVFRLETRKKLGEENFSPLHAYSIRTMKETLKDAVIDEMYVSEMTGDTKHGWKIEFQSAIYNKRGQHYKKTWPGVLYLNNTPNGYRLMWSDKKTKTPIWAVGYTTMAQRKMVPKNGFLESYTREFCEELLKPEHVLPILKWIPLEHMWTSGSSIYPHGITQSDIYWVGGEVSTKKVLNKAYMHPHGVTKNIFGGINNIKTFDELRTVIGLLRVARGFNPQVLEKLDLATTVDFYRRSNNDISEVRKQIKSFFTHFGCKDQYLTQMFSNTSVEVVDPEMDTFAIMHRADNVVDAARTFSQIKSRTHRTAIKQHVARSRMSIEEIHDFITMEYGKIQTENKELEKNDFWNTFGLFDDKWIAEGIQMIVPKMTHDLVEWGAVQNNCIGTYADRVYSGSRMVIGFKDSKGKWIGHAEVTKDMYMTQLLGKHNRALTKETLEPIIKFLKDKLKVSIPSHYESNDDADNDRFN